MAPFLTSNRDLEMMPIEHQMQQMWQLAADRRSVRLSLPGLPVTGLAEPIQVNIDFATGAVDQIIERLTVLRAHMKPGLPPPKKRN
jgi:hypothetical protein